MLQDEKKIETKSGENERLVEKESVVVLPDIGHPPPGTETNFISYGQEGPPPIPPIDLDDDDDCLPCI